jgi:hypothetical protein
LTPGNVYEKRLIEAYIAENHKDPVNGEELEITDLIDLKSSRIVTPRPPTLTSIPSLLSTFQNEWDALALETFTIRQQLQETRQELATALYQHDAAVRVIARLTKERDEARDALSKVTIGAGATNNGDAMQIDTQGLPEELAAKVDATQETYALPNLAQAKIPFTDCSTDSPRADENALCQKVGLMRRLLENLKSNLPRNLSTLAHLLSQLTSLVS